MLSGIRTRILVDQAAPDAPRRNSSDWPLLSWLICNMSISSFGQIPSSIPLLLLRPDAQQAGDDV
jgi:hypothetical protein